MNKVQIRKVVYLCGVIFGLSFQAARADLLYDNSSNQTTNLFNPGTLEVGDEIVLTGGTTITNFTFQYYAAGLSGSATVELRFYANDGASVDGVPSYRGLCFLTAAPSNRIGEHQRPNVYSYNSDEFAGHRSAGFHVERAIFQPGEGSTGVPIFTSADGRHPAWIFQIIGKKRWHAAGKPGLGALRRIRLPRMDFAARIQEVPEPGHRLAGGSLGGVALLARLRRKR